MVETEWYALDESQADAVIREAFQEGWPEKAPESLEAGRKGYQITLWFVIDREHLIAEAFTEEQGTRFRIINRGTAPVVGVPGRKKLFELIRSGAASASSD